MGILKRLWDYSGWIIGGYTIYKQLQTAQSAKEDLYAALTPDEQAKWRAVFGDPTAAANVKNLQLPGVPVPTATEPTAAHLVAGT